jgi:hypothetical protein
MSTQSGRISDNHQVRGAGEGVRLSTAGLAVTEHRRVESLDGHFDQSLNATIGENILLGCTRLEHHVVRKQFRLLQVILTLTL